MGSGRRLERHGVLGTDSEIPPAEDAASLSAHAIWESLAGHHWSDATTGRNRRGHVCALLRKKHHHAHCGQDGVKAEAVRHCGSHCVRDELVGYLGS